MGSAAVSERGMTTPRFWTVSAAYDEQSRNVKEFGSRVSVGPGVKAAPLFEAYLSSRLPPVKQ
jgi:hypothetical protein